MAPSGHDEPGEGDGSKEDFIVFREADSDRVSVLYRRRDRTYGLVTPDF